MTQLRYDSIEMLANSPWFAPQAMSGKTEEVIRTFAGLGDLLKILPMRGGKLPFTFRDEVRQNILTIAPKVSSAQDTPLDTMSYIDQVFEAYEARFGHIISERNADQAPINLAQRAQKRIGKAVANRIFYEAFKVFRLFNNYFVPARFSNGPATKWGDPGSDPLYDIEAQRTYVGNLTGQAVDFMIMSRTCNAQLKIHPDITTNSRNNVDAQFRDGDLVRLNGMDIVIIPEVQFTLPSGAVAPMFPDVLTSDSVTWHNFVIFGRGGDDLGYSGAVSTAGGGNSLAPVTRNYTDAFNRRLGVMGFVEMVHVIQDYFALTVLNNVI